MIKFTKVKQFRNVVKDIKFLHSYVGKDEHGNSVYKDKGEYPSLNAYGTVKVHGTNASVVLDKNNKVSVQSRNNRLSLDGSDGNHYDFVYYVQENLVHFVDALRVFRDNENPEFEEVVVYGEWAGLGVQKGVAVSELPKSFFIFGMYAKDSEGEVHKYPSTVLNTYDNFHNPDIRAYTICNFPTYSVKIDFNNPQKSLQTLEKLTLQVEKECPVGKHFGISGYGEGIVWSVPYNGETFLFKTKGQKHSVTKVKKVATIDPEKLESIDKFVEYSVTHNRIMQGIHETKINSRRDTGHFLRWVSNDILSEESDTLDSNGLTWKDVAKSVNKKAREMFFKYLDENMQD